LGNLGKRHNKILLVTHANLRVVAKLATVASKSSTNNSNGNGNSSNNNIDDNVWSVYNGGGRNLAMRELTWLARRLPTISIRNCIVEAQNK